MNSDQEHPPEPNVADEDAIAFPQRADDLVDEGERSSPEVPQPATTEAMLVALESVAHVPFATQETTYDSFMSTAELAVQSSDLYGLLLDIHRSLLNEFVVGKIRGIDAWSNGETEFRLVKKPWESVVDKLYRINIEENRLFSLSPQALTIEERAEGRDKAVQQRWITPANVHEVADDLLRTKFVVPFVDGVIDVSDRIMTAIEACGLRRFRRFHAKDSGYHARHIYVLLPVPQTGDADTTIALEIKVLTKMQDTLGELTHLLYEKHRTGEIPLEKKRKVAWQLESPDFLSTYLGHSGHLLEAAVAELKAKILDLGAWQHGES